jgi:hypothetical protein
MITTGLRITGIVHITLEAVVVIIDNGTTTTSTARETGVTTEKGEHLRHFRITPRVGELLVEWVTHHRSRRTVSPYLFPHGRGNVHGYTSPRTLNRAFHQIATRAGLHGAAFHPHNIRHTVIQKLWDCGMNATAIAKPGRLCLSGGVWCGGNTGFGERVGGEAPPPPPNSVHSCCLVCVYVYILTDIVEWVKWIGHTSSHTTEKYYLGHESMSADVQLVEAALAECW